MLFSVHISLTNVIFSLFCALFLMNCGNVVRFAGTVTLPAIPLLDGDPGFLEGYEEQFNKVVFEKC
jgi:hypothetical protein